MTMTLPENAWKFSMSPQCRVGYRTVPIEWYIEQIRERKPFALARWSDGEWPCVLGRQGANTDKHPYSPELRRDLTQCLLERPRYVMGLQELVPRTIGQEVHDWLEERELWPDWVQGGVFHTASIENRLGPFIAALAERGVILVGPKRLGALAVFPIRAHIETPLFNCHSECERVVEEAAAAIARLGTEPVVSISASMSANVIVHRLNALHPEATLIDIGSLWEPYVGVANRRYHKKIVERLAAGAA